jgi:hypothetical protein
VPCNTYLRQKSYRTDMSKSLGTRKLHQPHYRYAPVKVTKFIDCVISQSMRYNFDGFYMFTYLETQKVLKYSFKKLFSCSIISIDYRCDLNEHIQSLFFS